MSVLILKFNAEQPSRLHMSLFCYGASCLQRETYLFCILVEKSNQTNSFEWPNGGSLYKMMFAQQANPKTALDVPFRASTGAPGDLNNLCSSVRPFTLFCSNEFGFSG